MFIKLTPNNIKTLCALFTNNIKPGTLLDIARQVDGRAYKSDTYSFLVELTKISCLTMYRKTNESENIYNGMKTVNGKEFPVYEVDKGMIVEIWTKRVEYKFSEAMMRSKYSDYILLPKV